MTNSLVYGLKVQAPFPLPGPKIDGEPDVVIKEGIVPEALSGAEIALPQFQRDSTSCLISAPELGKVLIEGTTAVTLDCPKDLPAAWKTTFALGSALGVLLHLRGNLPLHGTAWVANGEATLVLGQSGRGKSTLAAAMLLNGYQLLTDDIIPTQLRHGQPPIAHPAHPRFKLSKPLLRELGIPIEGLESVLPNSDKLAWEIPAAAFSSNAAPITRCVLLTPRRSTSKAVELSPVSGPDALLRLRRQVYRPGLIKPLNHQQELFQLSLQLASVPQVSLCSLPEISAFESFYGYADAIHRDFAQ